MNKTIRKIEKLGKKYKTFSDEQLRAQTEVFRKRYKAGESLDSMLPEAFAVVREAAWRTLKMRHFKVQLQGGIVLHQGRIAEMATGQGKTLVATLPSYLNAIPGKGVHVVTVNDYLAKRDAEWMGQVHRFLGLTVGVITQKSTTPQRKEAYNCDITYITNNELGFDYLRDNMAMHKSDQVQRGLNYAIIDEVDSILIDEARTPLIISQPGTRSTEIYRVCNHLASTLIKGEKDKDLTKMDAIIGERVKETGDFIIDEKDKIASLTEDGTRKVERFFHIENLADPKNLEIQHAIILALRAQNLMHRDKDYVVRDGEILIVDEFTGRIMDGRRFSDGLHQAIEAKEGVDVKDESVTLATVTFQNFFNKYTKKAGMTGTAKTEEKEFKEIYNMPVSVIPTNKPVARIDHEDSVYVTKQEKYEAVVEDVINSHKTGQPILVGTATIDVSETISKMLHKAGISHQVLNAKHHEKEAAIIAEAGKHGAVTIATNMAGRGTDIILDEESKKAGGLKVIGTERFESRRIDNQLRGRSGRQGDPGESKFYLSLEDDILRLFGSEKLMTQFRNLGIGYGEEVKHRMVSNAIMKAQRRIEGNHFGARKSLLDYDLVMNDQREIIYSERQNILDGGTVDVPAMIAKSIKDVEETAPSAESMKARLEYIFMDKISLKETTKSAVRKECLKKATNEYKKMRKEFSESLDYLEPYFFLRILDLDWKYHLDNMEQLKQGITLESYGGRDPVVEYKLQGYKMFTDMCAQIEEDTIRNVFNVDQQKIREAQRAV